MDTKTATLIKSIPTSHSTVGAAVFRLKPPVSYTGPDGKPATTEHVVVSASIVPTAGPETYIFASDEDGTILSWSELDGSLQGVLDHAEALRAAGYEVLPIDACEDAR